MDRSGSELHSHSVYALQTPLLMSSSECKGIEMPAYSSRALSAPVGRYLLCVLPEVSRPVSTLETSVVLGRGSAHTAWTMAHNLLPNMGHVAEDSIVEAVMFGLAWLLKPSSITDPEGLGFLDYCSEVAAIYNGYLSQS
ncbi:hypothetical protein KEM56_007707 [Ascosphaera pollenicola]|nr:hypothetical protein KEM56_007707 [Ascosphaera pollenicola]